MVPEDIRNLRETLPAYCCFTFPLISLQEAKGTRTIYFEMLTIETMVWQCLAVIFYNCQVRPLRINYPNFSGALQTGTRISPFSFHKDSSLTHSSYFKTGSTHPTPKPTRQGQSPRPVKEMV